MEGIVGLDDILTNKWEHHNVVGCLEKQQTTKQHTTHKTMAGSLDLLLANQKESKRKCKINFR